MSPPGQTTAGFGTAHWRRPACACLPTPSWLLLLCCTLPGVSCPGCWPSTGCSRSLTGRAPCRQTTPDRRSNSGNSSTHAFLAAQVANRLHSPLSRQPFQLGPWLQSVPRIAAQAVTTHLEAPWSLSIVSRASRAPSGSLARPTRARPPRAASNGCPSGSARSRALAATICAAKASPSGSRWRRC